MSYDFAWMPYVSVAERRRNAERELAKLKKKGQSVAPVTIEGRTIADSFWGKAWCTNLEGYSDYANRLPRGRSYVRNGFVLDLQIAKGEVAAIVAGSDLYKVKIAVGPVKSTLWKTICRDCAGTIDSLVELLQGRLAKSVMDRVCRKGDGLFPSPDEIKLSCSCPDWADMCKHVAAVLYGVGARLDERPQLLFVLRGVDETELIAHAGQDFPLAKAVPAAANVLADDDVAALFGLDMAETADANVAAASGGHKGAEVAGSDVSTASKQRKRPRSAGAHAIIAERPAASKKPALSNTARRPAATARRRPKETKSGSNAPGKAETPAANTSTARQNDPPRAVRSKPEPKRIAHVRRAKRR
jgi:uncharacterized Zn finger protein